MQQISTKAKYTLAVFSIGFVLLCACAKIGGLSGGPIDIDPPVMVEADPENYSTNFDEKEIEVEFDEFIQLKNTNQELIVSPPFNKQPVVRIKGMGFVIEFEDTLKENVTYTFNFGNSVVDNNEGNILKNFEYVFSTGEYIDSMSISGSLKNAFNLRPNEESFLICLYKHHEDSIPYLDIPNYIGKTDEQGNFTLNNIKDGAYKIFAIKDGNNNMLFDLPDEKIAFVDSLIVLNAEYIKEVNARIEAAKIKKAQIDSVSIDSLLLSSDSLYMDSILQNDKITKVDTNSILPDSLSNLSLVIDSLNADSALIDSSLLKPKRNRSVLHIDLLSFEEYHQTQYLLENKRPERRLVQLMFNLPVDSNFNVTPLHYDVSNWGTIEDNYMRDTFNIWLTDTALVNCDTLKLITNYTMLDSMNKEFIAADTILFRYKDKEIKKRKKDEADTLPPPIEKLIVNFSQKSGGAQDLHTGISISSKYPFNEIFLDSLQLFEIVDDTVFVPTSYDYTFDSIALNKIHLYKNWEELTSYQLLLASGGIQSIYNTTNDSLSIMFTTRELEEYGKIMVSIPDTLHTIILQLLNGKEKVLREQTLIPGEKITFEYLNPGKYMLKAIIDENNNGLWDTGNYIEKKQPERVLYYKNREQFELKANWDFEIEWKIEIP